MGVLTTVCCIAYFQIAAPESTIDRRRLPGKPMTHKLSDLGVTLASKCDDKGNWTDNAYADDTYCFPEEPEMTPFSKLWGPSGNAPRLYVRVKHQGETPGYVSFPAVSYGKHNGKTNVHFQDIFTKLFEPTHKLSDLGERLASECDDNGEVTGYAHDTYCFPEEPKRIPFSKNNGGASGTARRFYVR